MICMRAERSERPAWSYSVGEIEVKKNKSKVIRRSVAVGVMLSLGLSVSAQLSGSVRRMLAW